MAVSYIGNFIAIKFNGTGNFKETFAFICYGYSFNIVPAVSSAVALLWLKAQINLDISALNSGVVGSASYIATLANLSIYGFFIFSLWLLYILYGLFSESHGISGAKSIVIAAIGIFAVWAINFLASNFIVGFGVIS